MSKRELVTSRRDEILSLAAKHGATSVKLFGSSARGDDDLASDIDFVVELRPAEACSILAAFNQIWSAFSGAASM